MNATKMSDGNTVMEKSKNTKRSTLALIAFILGMLYLVYSFQYWGGVLNETSSQQDTFAAIGSGFATMLVLPHLIATVFAVLFNLIGFLTNRRAFVLTAGILYSVAILFFIVYFMFVILQAILCFIAYARMKQPKLKVSVD